MNTSDISYEIIENYGPYSDSLADLWKQTNNKANEYEHEKLTRSYFIELSSHMPDRSFVIAIRRQGKIIAFSLCLNGDEELFVVHGGIDYQYNKDYHLHFNLHFLELLEAMKRNKKSANLGITNYDFKLSIGCELQPLIYFVKHIAEPKLTPAFSEILQKSIQQPNNNHRPFKNQDISTRVQLENLNNEVLDSNKDNTKDIFKKAFNFTRADMLKISDLYSFFPIFESTQRPIIQNLGKPIIMLGSNSYLGLGQHPGMLDTAKAAIDIYGTGCSGSPFLNGTLDVHAELAHSLAKHFTKDDAILFSTGYQTNLGVISAIVGRHEVIITDALNHASIIDGSLFSRGEIAKYRHNDMNSLEETLQKYPDKGKLLVVDAVFSMEGTLANLPEIVELAKKYNTRIMVDEAHALGVLGERGCGGTEHFGLLDEVDLIMGTFSKSFAAVGGFVAGESKVIDYLRHMARSHMFSASLPPSVVATIRKALGIIIHEPERRKKVLANAKFMAEELQNLGFEAPYRGTAIVPIYCKDELLTLALFKKLFNQGVYTNPVLSPAVPKGEELLRTSYMATHDEEDLLKALDIFKRVRTPDFPK